MHESDNYYEEILYPLQNGVLSTLAACDVPFYLTGGTALHSAPKPPPTAPLPAQPGPPQEPVASLTGSWTTSDSGIPTISISS